MNYPFDQALLEKWQVFIEALPAEIERSEIERATLQKLMSATLLIDVSCHSIYHHAKTVYALSQELVQCRDEEPGNEAKQAACDLWLALLTARNALPLKLKHPRRMDGECQFIHSQRLMEGKTIALKSIELLDPRNDNMVEEVMQKVISLEYLYMGISMGGLYWVNNFLIRANLTLPGAKCLIARDSDDNIVAYSLGALVENVTTSNGKTAKVFYGFGLGRDPDFLVGEEKVGALLRKKMYELLNESSSCDFIFYQYIPSNTFHASLVNEQSAQGQTVSYQNKHYGANNLLEYEENICENLHSSIISCSNELQSYPSKEAIFAALARDWVEASSSLSNLLLSLLFQSMGLTYCRWFNDFTDEPAGHYLHKPIDRHKADKDWCTLTSIINDELWQNESSDLFFTKAAPSGIVAVKALMAQDLLDYSSLKNTVLNDGSWWLFQSRLTAALYKAIKQSENASQVLELLPRQCPLPKHWIELINAPPNLNPGKHDSKSSQRI